MNCMTCNKELIGRQTKFCSRICKNENTNAKHQNYESQQKRGLNRKIELIKLFNGCCSRCGYKKNIAALEFHHTNPKEKDKGLDIRKLSNSTWDWCLKEAMKCILLCSNCHHEHHYPHLQIKEQF